MAEKSLQPSEKKGLFHWLFPGHAAHSSGTYRADIDGLRAIAVLAVVVYHAIPDIIPGGFVGVDVFFVISGFLITSILERNIRAGTFSISGFYERRLRRIAPALLAMILATIFFAAWRFPPHLRVEHGRSVMFTTLSVANHFFLRSAEDYFHSPVDTSPLLHTWSLAVEEQFYVFFPVLLFFIAKCSRRSSTKLLILGLVAIASFAAAQWNLRTNPAWCFYLLPLRAWELLLGAVLALWMETRAATAKPRKFAPWISALGMTAIGIAYFGFDRDTPFPGLAALLPCAGAALIIWAGGLTDDSSKNYATRLLASPPLVAIGLISYSVYLWHWPLIVFFRDLLPAAFFNAAIVLASILAGYVSWRCVETPFRLPGRFQTRQLVVGWLALSALFLYYSRHIRKNDGFLVQPDARIREILAYKSSLNPYQKLAFDKSVPPDRPFVYGDTNVVPRYALWGDSHANALALVMGDVARSNRQSFKFYGRGGTRPVLGVYSSKFGRPNPKETGYTPVAFTNLLSDTNITTVVLCARWIMTFKGAALSSREVPMIWTPFEEPSPDKVRDFFVERLSDTLRRLNEAGKKVVVMYPTPELGINCPQLVAAEVLEPEKKIKLPGERDFFERQAPVFKIFDQLPASPGLIRARPYQYLIKDGGLIYRDGVVPLYHDDHHLNPVGASRIVPLFQKLFDGTLRDEAGDENAKRFLE